MKVLVACEESQRVCSAFRKLGHEAYSCDIQECSGGAKEVNSSGSISSESRNHGTVPKCNGNPQLKWAEKGRKWIIENINDWKTAC